MNLFFVFGSGEQIEVVTPASPALLPGVTRDSILVLAKELGYRSPSGGSPPRSGSKARPTARSPRSSPAAPRP